MIRLVYFVAYFAPSTSLLPLVPEVLGVCEIFFRLGFLTFLGIRDATVVIRQGVLRVEANRFGVVSDGFVELTLLFVGQASVAIHCGIFRVEADRLGVISDGFVEVSLLEVNIAPAPVWQGIFGIQVEFLRYNR